jgi:hypothetical protein
MAPNLLDAPPVRRAEGRPYRTTESCPTWISVRHIEAPSDYFQLTVDRQ